MNISKPLADTGILPETRLPASNQPKSSAKIFITILAKKNDGNDYGIIEFSVLVASTLNTERYSNNELENKRDKRNRKRNSHITENFVLNGFAVR